MVKGLNTDIILAGRSLHLQTEDLGRKNGRILSQVFSQGQVIRKYETRYQKNELDLAIRRKVQEQHTQILDFCRSQFSSGHFHSLSCVEEIKSQNDTIFSCL